MVAVDPLASLAIHDIEVTIGGQDYTMEGRPALDWLEVIIAMDLASVLPGWLGSAAELFILDELVEDRITVEELDRATRDAMTVAAGRSWWWAQKLILSAASDVHTWSRINGRLMLAGVDPGRISLSAWVDAVYVIYAERVMTDTDEYTKWKVDIDMPPSIEEIDEEAEEAAFMSMLG